MRQSIVNIRSDFKNLNNMNLLFSPDYLLLSLSLAVVMQFVEKYLFNDWTFLKFLIVLIMLDTALGFINNWKRGTISSKGFGDIFYKLLVYSSVLITGHVIMYFTVHGEHVSIKGSSFFDDILMSGMILRESISIFENIAKIRPNLLPKFILKKLHDFDSESDKPIQPQITIINTTSTVTPEDVTVKTEVRQEGEEVNKNLQS